MALLEKTNPAATPASVRRAAIIGAGGYALLFIVGAACLNWRDVRHADWQLLATTFVPWVMFGALVGALMNWQPPDMPQVGELLGQCELTFAVRLPNEKLSLIESVGDLHREVVDALRSQRGEASLDESAVWLRLKSLIVDELGVHEDEIVPSARFLYELA